MIQIINKTKSWFFEEINKIDKSLAKLRDTETVSKLTKNRNGKEDITAEMRKFKKIIRSYHKCFYSKILENLHEKDDFLDW